MAALLELLTEEWVFSLESRQKLGRVGTSPELQSQLVDSLRSVLASLLGPFAHVSSSFHAQFKAASAMQHTVDHGGYEQQNKHMELHGAYLLHQDFAGAAIPTSPGGQVSPEDVVRVYRASSDASQPVLSKARRRERPDGLQRAIISLGYNALMNLFFPRMPSSDVNANPKFLTASVLHRMDLGSDDWFLEAEIMLKARYMGLSVLEVEVGGKPRESGRSHVRGSAILEFFKNMIRYRFGRTWKQWRRQVSRDNYGER